MIFSPKLRITYRRRRILTLIRPSSDSIVLTLCTPPRRLRICSMLRAEPDENDIKTVQIFYSEVKKHKCVIQRATLAKDNKLKTWMSKTDLKTPPSTLVIDKSSDPAETMCYSHECHFGFLPFHSLTPRLVICI